MTVVGAAEFLSAHLPADRAALLAARLDRLPDPTEAMRALERLAAGGVFPADVHRADAVLTLAGCSPYLGRLIVQHPDFLDAFPAGDAGRGLPDRDDLEGEWSRFRGQNALGSLHSVLRLFKQRALLRIALADLLRTADLSQVTRALSTLADFAVRQAVAAAHAPLEAKHGVPTFRNDRGDLETSGFVVLALGKLGGEELNYSSDIDILYLFARDGETSGRGAQGQGVLGNREYFTRQAAETTRLVGGLDADGEVFRVDLNLRPGGRDGDLVTSIAAAVAYYRTWAEPWERQALLKVRPIAGDLELGRRFVAEVAPLIFPRRPDPYVAIEIGAMKDRIDEQLRDQGHSERDIKLGRGGIREMEFAVQALQLQRGGDDPWLRQGNTLLALHRLSERGLIGFAEYARLADAYAYLRDVEHRLQMGENRQTSLLPTEPEALEKLSRTLLLGDERAVDDTPSLSADLERHRSVVRAFYDSVIGQAAQLAMQEETTDLLLDRLAEGELLRRLRQAGFPDAEALVKPVQGLRRLLQPAAHIPERSHALRRAGPALLQAALHAANPRRALAHLETLFSVLLAEPDSLRRFLEHRELLAQTITMFGRSDLVAQLLIRQPDVLRALEDRALLARTPGPEEARALLLEAVRAPGTIRERAAELRRRHQSQLAAIATRDINRQGTVRESIRSLSSLADAALQAALELAHAEVRGGERERIPISILGLGRLGYREIDYGSDLDLVFVHDPAGGDSASRRAKATQVCEAVVRILSTLSRDGQLYRVDLRLRPSGNKGELVVSPQELRAYFSADAEIWEMQSFLKARAVAGEPALGEGAVEEVEGAILARCAGIPESTLAAAIREMRGRLVDAGKRGVSARRLKHGTGGLADIDFAIEYLQLRHRLSNPAGKDTLRLLTHLLENRVLEQEALRTLYEGYLFLRSIDHALRLINGLPPGALPTEPSRLAELAAAIGLEGGPEDPGETLVRTFDARTSAVRRVYEAVIPGAAPG